MLLGLGIPSGTCGRAERQVTDRSRRSTTLEAVGYAYCQILPVYREIEQKMWTMRYNTTKASNTERDQSNSFISMS